MLLAVALTAHAEPQGVAEDVACAPLTLTRSIPSANATDVPVDVSPTLIFEGNCGGSTDWTLEIADAEGNVLHSQAWTWDGNMTALATMDPAEDLPADSDLVLRATPSGPEWGTLVEVPFSTGSEHLAPLAGLPTVEITSAVWWVRSQTVEVTADITPAADPHGLSIIRVTSPNASFIVSAEPLVDQPFAWFEAESPDEACVSVVQIDGSGVPTEPVEACADPVNRHSGGCFSRETPVSSRAVLLLPALLLFRRRAR